MYVDSTIILESSEIFQPQIPICASYIGRYTYLRVSTKRIIGLAGSYVGLVPLLNANNLDIMIVLSKMAISCHLLGAKNESNDTIITLVLCEVVPEGMPNFNFLHKFCYATVVLDDKQNRT